MTLEGSLSNLLSGSWSLTGDLRKSKLYFGTGWYDKSETKPQIIVTPLSSPVGRFFGTSTATLHHRFVVNCWLRIPSGADGASQKDDIEDLREEVFRILNSNRDGINAFDISVPLDEGTPHHELDSTPQILRYELVVFGVETKS